MLTKNVLIAIFAIIIVDKCWYVVDLKLYLEILWFVYLSSKIFIKC